MLHKDNFNPFRPQFIEVKKRNLKNNQTSEKQIDISFMSISEKS